MSEDWDVSDASKSGLVYFKELYSDSWLPAFFAIDGSKLLCTEIETCDSPSDTEEVLPSVLIFRHLTQFKRNENHNEHSSKRTLFDNQTFDQRKQSDIELLH